MSFRSILLVAALAAAASGPCAAPAAAAGAARAIRLPRPTWRPGFTWTYLRTPGKAPEQRRTIEYTMLQRSRLEDGSYYVLRRGGREFFYSLDLGFRMSRGGRVERENRPAFPAFRGLWQGHPVWEQRLEILVADQPPRIGGGTFRIVGRERVPVPAGTFDTVHITFTEGGKLNREYWYSPVAKWFVLEKVYWREGGWTDELQSYRAK